MDEPAADSSKLDGDEPAFTLGDPGKADGALSSEDRARVEAAFDNVIAESQAKIVALEAEIAMFEANLPAKKAEADALVLRVQAREQEIRSNFTTNMMLCMFVPTPACFLASVLANDSALQSYKAQLAAAQAEQSRMATGIVEYGKQRDVLRARIGPLREGKERLLAMLRGDVPHTLSPTLSSDPATAEAYWRVTAMRDVQVAVAEEVALLLEIRRAVVELSNTLDQSLKTLRTLEENVEEIVEQQRAQFMDLLVGFATGDADAVAQDFLDQQIAARTRTLLGKLGWPLDEFVHGLTDERELAFKLLGTFVGAAQPSHYVMDTPRSIVDSLPTWSFMRIDETDTIHTVEVSVDIEHAHVGDLVISLEHDRDEYVLQSRVGGAANQVHKTFVVDVGTSNLQGLWTLRIGDMEAGDVGTLRSWHLLAY